MAITSPAVPMRLLNSAWRLPQPSSAHRTMVASGRAARMAAPAFFVSSTNRGTHAGLPSRWPGYCWGKKKLPGSFQISKSFTRPW